METKNERRRRSIRLKGYDYSQSGAYFVALCSHKRETIFEDERYRQVVEKYWFDLPRHYPHVELDEFVIMPNHVHGIIWIVGAPLGAPQIENPGSKQGAASSAPTLARRLLLFLAHEVALAAPILFRSSSATFHTAEGIRLF